MKERIYNNKVEVLDLDEDSDLASSDSSEERDKIDNWAQLFKTINL